MAAMCMERQHLHAPHAEAEAGDDEVHDEHEVEEQHDQPARLEKPEGTVHSFSQRERVYTNNAHFEELVGQLHDVCTHLGGGLIAFALFVLLRKTLRRAPHCQHPEHFLLHADMPSKMKAARKSLQLR